MRIVGLLSGGKDSVYSLQCAAAAGHTIVALAHVSNSAPGAEPDSYMYQSVASECAAAVAACIGVPLFIRQRSGTAVTQDIAYAAEGVKGDEVEVMLQCWRTSAPRGSHLRALSPGPYGPHTRRRAWRVSAPDWASSRSPRSGNAISANSPRK